VRFRLVVDESNRTLLTGSHCSEVAVKAGLTVYKCEFCSNTDPQIISFLETEGEGRKKRNRLG
jgi:hypothetical protein